MANAVLERLLAQRQEQFNFIDQTLQRVEAEERDLVDAEQKNLEGARQRIVELTEQIKPLEAFEELRSTHNLRRSDPCPDPRPVLAVPRKLGGEDRAPVYRSAGEFIVDLVRARGIHSDPDPEAAPACRPDPGRGRPEDLGHDGHPADAHRRLGGPTSSTPTAR